ncbi:Fur family transcriptional regulator [Ferrimonas marina]|uniref:Fur family transcriptional regulator, zinc uptake regulator n=1 Tax=Ferrimonas marina TaxID=299255 RepID=A0A1M5RHJ4_9GAMM|nr:transcriptional repressor [Ferrimonas marina]SHH25499.1 Fur family transcriptional regulator, zinc uptake regulator [Ferrimonas marina]
MDIDKVLERSAAKCQGMGGKLTAKRRDLLSVLLRADHPLSAYELTEHYNRRFDGKLQPMSTYRMLDFLVQMQLVHKLSSVNKYLACAHIACQHQHADQHFVVCHRCGAAKEINIDNQQLATLLSSVTEIGYQLRQPQLELDGVCEKCADVSRETTAALR